MDGDVYADHSGGEDAERALIAQREWTLMEDRHSNTGYVAGLETGNDEAQLQRGFNDGYREGFERGLRAGMDEARRLCEYKLD